MASRVIARGSALPQAETGMEKPLLLLLPLQALLLLRVHAISRASSCVYQPHTGLIRVSDGTHMHIRRVSVVYEGPYQPHTSV